METYNDLSLPEGCNINDAFSQDLCSLSYIKKVEEAAATAVVLGKGSQIAKIDIKSAYSLVHHSVCSQSEMIGHEMEW